MPRKCPNAEVVSNARVGLLVLGDEIGQRALLPMRDPRVDPPIQPPRERGEGVEGRAHAAISGVEGMKRWT